MAFMRDMHHHHNVYSTMSKLFQGAGVSAVGIASYFWGRSSAPTKTDPPRHRTCLHRSRQTCLLFQVLRSSPKVFTSTDSRVPCTIFNNTTSSLHATTEPPVTRTGFWSISRKNRFAGAKALTGKKASSKKTRAFPSSSAHACATTSAVDTTGAIWRRLRTPSFLSTPWTRRFFSPTCRRKWAMASTETTGHT